MDLRKVGVIERFHDDCNVLLGMSVVRKVCFLFLVFLRIFSWLAIRQ